MATKNQPRDATRSKKRTIRQAEGRDQLIIGSEIGVTIPVGDTTAHLRFSFWSERLTKDSTLVSIRDAVEKMEDFNEETLERNLKKAMRTIRQALEGDSEPPKKNKKHAGKVSVRDRARARVA